MSHDCRSMLPLLLEAEPDELRGRGASDVATHVRACPACAARARRVLEAESALDGYLGAARGKLGVDAVLAAVDVAAPAAAPGAPRSAGSPSSLGSGVRVPAWGRWGGLAAAAAVAALLLLPGREPPALPVVARTEAPPPLVESAEGRTVAVMATADPDITVLWFFDR